MKHSFAPPVSAAALALLVLALTTAAHAQSAAAKPQLMAEAAIALDFDDAVALATKAQPQLEALGAEANAERAGAIAAGELPDPTLSFGISEIPINTADRFSLRRDGDTDLALGLRQAFPRAEKRRLRQTRGEREAEVITATRDATARRIAREAGLAWLEVWRAEAAKALALQSLELAQKQKQSAEIDYRVNRRAQSDFLKVAVETAAMQERVAGFAQQSQHARNQLARWIGEAAFGPICPDLPSDATTDAAELIAALTSHPHLLAESNRVALADTDIALAQQDYHPDWAVNVALGYRPAFSEMATLQFELPLPIFTGKRQDQQLQAAYGRRRAEQARLADSLREHIAEIRLNVDDWKLLQARLERYDQSLLPQARQSVDAALSSYAAGGGTLAAVLGTRRSLIDLELQRLELQHDAASHQVQLRYFAPERDHWNTP